MPLQIVDFSNFAVHTPEELFPEESNCRKRKPADPSVRRRPPPKNDPAGISLANCELELLSGLEKLIQTAIFYPENLVYIDLSQNQISRLDGLEKFTQVRILYLHGNNIPTVEVLAFLEDFSALQTLTVHGNPLVVQQGFRHWIINLIPSLKRLDSAAVTASERQTVQIRMSLKSVTLKRQQ